MVAKIVIILSMTRLYHKFNWFSTIFRLRFVYKAVTAAREMLQNVTKFDKRLCLWYNCTSGCLACNIRTAARRRVYGGKVSAFSDKAAKTIGGFCSPSLHEGGMCHGSKHNTWKSDTDRSFPVCVHNTYSGIIRIFQQKKITAHVSQTGGYFLKI